MSRLFLAVALTVALALGPVTIAGQTNESGNVTVTESEIPTEEPVETVAIEIDEQTVLSEWSYGNGTWTLTFEAEIPRQIVITDSAKIMEAWENADGKTSADPQPERYTLTSGETTVTYAGSTFDGQAAITVATTDGMRFLATDGISTDRGAVPWNVAQGLIALFTFGGAGGAALFVKRRYTSQDIDVERIA